MGCAERGEGEGGATKIGTGMFFTVARSFPYLLANYTVQGMFVPSPLNWVKETAPGFTCMGARTRDTSDKRGQSKVGLT